MTGTVEGRAARRLGSTRTRAQSGQGLSWAWLGAALLLIAGAAHAASLQISPIRLDLSAAQPAAVLTLHNRGTAPINAQVRVFAWSQTPDEDHLESTASVVASPPIISIAPDSDQTVRILRTSANALGEEETYRLLIDEIPTEQNAQTTAVRVQLRYSVPVFVGGPASERPPAVEFALARTPSGPTQSQPGLALSASNPDGTHAQLSQVRIEWPGGMHSDLGSGLLGYALAHNARRWPIGDAPADATNGILHAVVNGTPLVRRIDLDSQRTRSAGEARTP